jgi:hypothetical protein
MKDETGSAREMPELQVFKKSLYKLLIYSEKKSIVRNVLWGNQGVLFYYCSQRYQAALNRSKQCPKMKPKKVASRQARRYPVNI